MLTTRQEKILELIVREYIKTARPVGSKLLCHELKCSSATIRNEMATLEDLNYLEKTHVSSGRVPSEKGYRYYVDNLMQLNTINGEDLLKLQIIFNNNKIEINSCLKKSLEIVAEMTDCTSIVLGSKANLNRLKKVEVLPLSENSLLAIIVTDKGHVEHRNMNINNIPVEEIEKSVALINKLLIGTPIDEINQKLEFEVKPVINQYVKQYEAIYSAFYQVFNDFTMDNVSIVGKNNMLNQPEFNNVEKIKSLYNKLDSQEVLNDIYAENNDISIYIGKESKVDDDVTVIKTKYKTGNDEGTIAIIGPKRMDYERIVSMLEYIKENISDK